MRRRNFLFGFAFVSALVVGGCGQSTSQESLAVTQSRAVSSGSGTVSLVIDNDWGSGYCGSVTVANQGASPITAWTVAIQLPNSSISDLWSAQYTQAGDVVTAQPLSGSGPIAGGSSTKFGFCANASAANHTPVIVSLDVVGGDPSGTGGAPGTGGSSATGGTTDTGGTSSADGGASDIGGSSNSGGSPGSGGSSTGGTTNAGVAVLVVNSDWKSGYCTNITLKNTGSVPSTDWTLVLNVPQATINDLWNGTYTKSGNTVTVKASGNGVIAAGQSTSIGYCAVTTGTSYAPSVVSFVLTTSQSQGSGGAPSSGGAPATGGKTATGGAPTGGTPATGGAATGGTPATGGAATGGKTATGGAPTGGKPATGGSPTGGTPATGGAATGGKTATGGAPTGGKPATGGAPSTGGSSSQGSVTASLKVTSDWGNGYCANIDIINGGTRQVTKWTVNVNIPSSQLTNAWSSSATTSGSVLSLAPVSYNQTIAPSASVGIGYCASATSTNHTPSIASVSSTN